MILGICEEPAILNVMRLVVLLIKILRVAVPIILIIVMMLRFASAMTKHDDAAVTKAMKSVVPNIIAAVLIFLVPSFVDIVVKISMPNSDYTKCISDVSLEKVNQAYNNKMDKLISDAESSLEYSDYTSAYAYLPNIKDAEKRQEYEAKLDAIKQLIDSNKPGKTNNCNNNYADVNYSNFKWHKYYSKKGPANKYYADVLPYLVWAPENVSDLNGVSLPLIVWLHGSGELSYNITLDEFVYKSLPRVLNSWKNSGLDNIPAIIVAPQAAGHWGSNPGNRDKNLDSIKAIIESAKEIYNVDTSKIVLMGHSLGSRGVIEVAYEMRKKYSTDYFNKLVTMSGGGDLIHPSKDDEEARSYFASKDVKGYAEPNTAANQFYEWINKPDNFRRIENSDHGTVTDKALKLDEDGDGVSDLVYWMFGKNEKCDESSNPSSPTPTGENPNAGITATCMGEYEGGFGSAKLTVNVTKGNASEYKFLIDNKVVQDSNSATYTADNEYVILINPKVNITSTNGQNTTISCTIQHSNHMTYSAKGYYFSAKASKDKYGAIDNPYPSNRLPYYIHIPENVSPNESLPLIVGLHGGYGIGTCSNGTKTFVTTEGTQTNHYFKNVFYYDKKDKYAINGGKDNNIKAIMLTISNTRCSWNGDMYGTMDIIHAIIKKYNVDLNHVILTGVSQGGAGTLYLGFLEEQILYKAKDNNTTLSSIASKYNTTVEAIESYNKSTKHSISYSNSSSKTLKSGTVTIIRSRNNNEPGSIFTLLMPFSPAQVNYRVGFVNVGGTGTPPHTLKTPIWVITSNDEYPKVQDMAKEVTRTYDELGDARYTVLTGLRSPHDSDTAFFNRTSAAKYVIGINRGQFKVKNNSEIDAIEKQMENNFAQTWRP